VNEFPQPPGSLEDEGRSRWIEIATILKKRGMWTDDWRPALEHLCRQYDYLGALDEAIKNAEATPEGFPMLLKGMGNNYKLNPIMDHRVRLVASIRLLLNDFKLTPAADKFGISTPDMTNGHGVDAPDHNRVDVPVRPRYEYAEAVA
jgi:phage terminase small subunit